MPSLATLVADRITAATDRTLPGAGPFDPRVRRSERADLQADGLLGLARSTGRAPREAAAAVAGTLAGDDLVAACVAAGPGFLNITLADAALWQRVAALLADPRSGAGRPQRGVRTVVDYSSPGVAKEMHVGHLRSTIIGDALVRVLEFLGGTVLRQNHIGDWGTQFGMLIQHLMERRPGADADPDDPGPAGGATVGDATAGGSTPGGGAAAVRRLTALYQEARLRFDTDPAFVERSRNRVVALQAGDPATLAAWRSMVAESTRYFSEVYDLLGVRLTAGDIRGESAYNDQLAGVVAELERAGVARVSEGALCVFFADVRGPDGAPVPLIVRKRDGGYGYPATDLAALRHRVRTLAADRLLYLTDVRQALHFRMVFDTARRAGWLPDPVSAEHLTFGAVLGPDGRPLKTRAGDAVRLAELLDAAVDRARAVVAAKNPDLPPAELAARARQVGIGAVKYADLSTGRGRDYVFDLDRMLALTGNTGVYLQYAHARIRSLLRRAGEPVHPDRIAPDIPLTGPERRLVLHLDGFGDLLAEVARTAEPHRLCGWLYALAQAYTDFYEHCPVLRAPAGVRENRLALSALTGEVLRTGLDLLGIAAPAEL
ncbi:arginine--tRNA ligase [Plantactinospora siamensis]|uniref:Arginine--tRNA ligase n=1 Tax=Plantactinospora siamensis TaxID=555372 RepID=A0ABV6NUR5_9ACTN